MATEPFKELFDPDLRKAAAKNQIESAVALLGELRNHGHHLFVQYSDRPSGGDENLVILFLFYHLVEMLDSVSVLVGESAVSPAQLPLRAEFEALLSLEYIVKAETVRRAHAYLVCDLIERLEFYANLDPETERGKQFKEAMAADPDCAHMKLGPPQPAAEEILRSVLDKELYKEAFEEYKRLRGLKRLYPSWHEFFGGPRSIRQLAKALNRQGSYEILYGGWSATGHGTDVIRRNLAPINDGPGVQPIRNPKLISPVVNMTVNLYLDAARLLIAKYRPGDARSFSAWYVGEVRALWFAFDGQDPPPFPPAGN